MIRMNYSAYPRNGAADPRWSVRTAKRQSQPASVSDSLVLGHLSFDTRLHAGDFETRGEIVGCANRRDFATLPSDGNFEHVIPKASRVRKCFDIKRPPVALAPAEDCISSCLLYTSDAADE